MSDLPRRPRLSADARRERLEDSAMACIARGGIRAFTVDRVAAEAAVSRGLITHHFGSMDGLLVAVYARMYRQWTEISGAPRPGRLRIEAMIEAFLSETLFSRDVLNIWLTLWGEIANNPVLRDEHRRLYDGYRNMIAGALNEAAAARGRVIDAATLAKAFICLIDGFGVQRSIEPALLTKAEARAACRAFLEPHLGPLDAGPAPS